MRTTALATSVVTLMLSVAAAAQSVSPDTVVATIAGEKLTAGDVERILSGTPIDIQEQMRDKPGPFLEQYALVSHLAREGEKEGLGETSPYKEQWAWNRLQILIQAAITAKKSELRGAGSAEEEIDAATRKWLDNIRDATEVAFENEAYYSSDPVESAAVSEDTVVVTLNGKPATVKDLNTILRGASPRVREKFNADRKQFLREYAMSLRLLEYAVEQKMEAESPYKEQLAWVRMNTLSQAKLNSFTNSISISLDYEKEYYQAHLDQYHQAKVKMIYIAFGTGDSVGTESNGKTVLSEEEARARIQSIRDDISGGADFVEMVQKYSDDETSKAQDGQFGPLKKSDNIPDHIKTAIFSLKPGELSEPIRQPNGFYLFRLEEIATLTLDEVRQDLRREAKDAKFREWFETVRQSVKVTFENEEYFAGAKQ